MDEVMMAAIKKQYGKDVEVYTWEEVRDAFKKLNATMEQALKFYISKGLKAEDAVSAVYDFYTLDGELRDEPPTDDVEVIDGKLKRVDKRINF